jgi:PilZ domain-containing protein
VKRLTELTIQDLAAAPVWRYEGGTGGEAIVTAEERSSLSQADEDVFLAATDFFLPDSSQHLGFCFPADAAGIEYLQPVIVTPAGQVRFWFDRAVAREALATQWGVLGKRAEEVFPVRFRCRVAVDGREIAGVIRDIETSEDWVSKPGELASAPGSRGQGAGGPSAEPRPTRVRPFPAVQSGRRTSFRHRVEMVVEFEQGGSHGAGVAGNVSRTGMFVCSTQPPNIGPALKLTLHLPGGRELHLSGRVVRSALTSDSSRPGFGLALTDKPEEYDQFLTRLLQPPR